MTTDPARPLDPLMTAEEVAAYRRISLSMVYKLRREGHLPGVPVGVLWRWNPDMVRAFGRGDPLPEPPSSVVPISGRRRRV